MKPRKKLSLPAGFALIAAGSVTLTFSASIAGAVLEPSNEPLSAKLATWGRDHMLGGVIDQLEQWRYSTPPKRIAADELDLAEGAVSSSPTSTPRVTPAALEPRVTPALKDEGRWRPEATAQGHTAIWVTGIRPLKNSPAAIATYAAFDQSLTVAGMWNGPEIPGNRGFSRYRSVDPALQPYLLATFNGGFRKEHSQGGYFNEGLEVWKLRPHIATLAIDKEGKIHIGALDEEFSRDGMVSLRQNLHLLVKDQKNVVGDRSYEFGAWKDGNLFILRSAICKRTDGLLMWAVVGPVNASQLATALVRAGCDIAMQLDVNAAWPKFMGYQGAPHTIDGRITGRPDMFLRSAPKDFFALFSSDMPAHLKELLK